MLDQTGSQWDRQGSGHCQEKAKGRNELLKGGGRERERRSARGRSREEGRPAARRRRAGRTRPARTRGARANAGRRPRLNFGRRRAPGSGALRADSQPRDAIPPAAAKPQGGAAIDRQATLRQA